MRRHAGFMRLTAAGVALAALVWAPRPGRADESWKPFLQDKKGNRSELQGKPEALKDKEWLDVRYPEFAGHKPRVAVVYANEKLDSPQPPDEWSRFVLAVYGLRQPQQETNPFNHIEDLVSAALGATHRFSLLERTTALVDVTSEQDLGASGRVDKKTAPQIGHMKGADFVVKPTVVEINPDKDPKSIKMVAGMLGSGGFGLGGLGLDSHVAFCRLYVKVVNATTGEIVEQFMMDGTAKSSGIRLGLGGIGLLAHGIGGGEGDIDLKKTAPLSDAMQSCANKIAFQVANKFEDLPWSGLVASVSGRRIYINGGTNVGLQEGLTLQLVSKGAPIPDPEDPNGPPIGFDQTDIGTLRVTSVQEKFAICELAQAIPGAPEPRGGDIVRLEAAKK